MPSSKSSRLSRWGSAALALSLVPACSTSPGSRGSAGCNWAPSFGGGGGGVPMGAGTDWAGAPAITRPSGSGAFRLAGVVGIGRAGAVALSLATTLSLLGAASASDSSRST